MGIEIDANLIKEVMRRGKRLDGRQAEQMRKIEIETNLVTSAEGSARIRLGDTEVLCGIKMELGEPYSDTPDEGVLMVGAELVPLASPEFESGRPGEEAVELARVVDRAIRESHAVDFGKLCIEPKKAVWMVFVDIDVLNDDGNLIDASCLAAVAALKTAKIPKLTKNADGDYEVDYEHHDGPIPMSGIPIEVTLAKVESSIVLDPTIQEFKALDARLTLGTIDIGGKIHMCSGQKGGRGSITLAEMDRMIALGVEKGEELRAKIRALK
jgi:exosome complex component RRP42